VNELHAGEVVILHDRAGRRYQVRLAAGATFSLHSGALAHDDLIDRPEGTVVTTRMGSRLLALRPTFAEQVTDRKRRAQPIYPKDLGAIVMRADLHPGAFVVEAGTGTGALTLAALRAVGPSGRVTSYEVREDFHRAAQAAVEDSLGALPPNLELKVGDVYEGISERGVDRVLLDLPEPWQAVAHVAEALRPGGLVFAHCPNVSQVQRFCDALRDRGGFGLLETVEVLERHWTVRGRSLRPAHRMVAHTGFLTFARRLAGDEGFESESEGF
jgi:tRNA (adenine57-N1/adenine58-N1)-methyltransferase